MSVVEDAQESANFPASHLLSLGCHLGLPLSLPWCVVAGISDPLYLPSFQPCLSRALPAPQTLGFQSHGIFCHGHPKDQTPPNLPPTAPQPCHTLSFPLRIQGSKRLCPPHPLLSMGSSFLLEMSRSTARHGSSSYTQQTAISVPR